MITNTRDRILKYIAEHKQARVHDLVKFLKIGNVATHRQLKKLVSSEKLKKIGKPPLVIYILNEEKPAQVADLSPDIRKFINTNYLYISAQGDVIFGLDGFIKWVEGIGEQKRILTLASEYAKTLDNIKKNTTPDGWIDATQKIKLTFTGDLWVDKLLYADFYSIPKFGKTKLGQLVLYAKQSQNWQLTEEVADMVKPMIQKIIDKYSIDALAYIPATVPRKLQFIEELAGFLQINIPGIPLIKISGQVIVAQKTLSALSERVINARGTIYLKNAAEKSFRNILLIDDAVGSGATVNEVAHKLKDGRIAKNKIIAFGIVGSYKGFDVIREV